MSESYTKDLIEYGKDLYAVEPSRTDKEKLEHLLNCASNTQTVIHEGLQEFGAMMWMAGNNTPGGFGNEHDILFGAGQLIGLLGEVLEASRSVEENTRLKLDDLKASGTPSPKAV